MPRCAAGCIEEAVVSERLYATEIHIDASHTPLHFLVLASAVSALALAYFFDT